MAIRINNNGRSIAVSKNNGYTVEKVQKAVEFVKHANRRGTKLEDYLSMYNYLRDANETLPNCKSCGFAKYIAAVENYAKYGYLTLVASGIDERILNGEIEAVEASDSPQETQDDSIVEGDTVVSNNVGDTEENATEDAENDGDRKSKRKVKGKKK